MVAVVVCSIYFYSLEARVTDEYTKHTHNAFREIIKIKNKNTFSIFVIFKFLLRADDAPEKYLYSPIHIDVLGMSQMMIARRYSVNWNHQFGGE